MSDIFEELKNIENETEEKIDKIKQQERLEEDEKYEMGTREKENKRKGAKNKIIELIKDPNPELDKPKMWGIECSMEIDGMGNTMPVYKRTIMTERQIKLLEETDSIFTLIGISKDYSSVDSITEIPGEKLNEEERIKLDAAKQKMELLKTSTDPKLDEKGLYNCKVKESGYDESIEISLREALLVTIPETISSFKTYDQMEKGSKITFKSIKQAIKNKLHIR